MEYTLLNNGIKIPMLGLGTYRIGKTDNDVYRAIRTALDVGYRHIDTATLYGNEAPIGKAIRWEYRIQIQYDLGLWHEGARYVATQDRG